VAVARALIGDRRILLADEPTGALETTSAEHVMQVIRDRTRDDRAAIVATHDQRLAAYADRVIYVKDGKIVGQVGAPVDADVRARA
jgi:putative ABC transport system ATP-binding protein